MSLLQDRPSHWLPSVLFLPFLLLFSSFLFFYFPPFLFSSPPFLFSLPPLSPCYSHELNCPGIEFDAHIYSLQCVPCMLTHGMHLPCIMTHGLPCVTHMACHLSQHGSPFVTTWFAMCRLTPVASKYVKFRLSQNSTKFDWVARFRKTIPTV